MSKVIKKIKTKLLNKKTINQILVFGICVTALTLNSHYAHAEIDTSKLNSINDFVSFILSLATKLGAALAVWGGIDVALSLKSDSAEQKEKGIKLLEAGIGVICVGASGSWFMSL